MSAADALPLPRDPGEITLNWLNAVLGATPPVTGFTSEVIGVGEGFAGSLARLTLNYGDVEGDTGAAGLESVIVKFAAADPAVREVLEAFGGYTRESRFYGELAGQTPVATPHCYYTRIEADGTNVVVMEDLTGGWVGDQVAGASLEETRALFAQLARMHAHWWNSPELAALEWAVALDVSMEPETLKAYYMRGLERFEAEFEGRFTYSIDCARALVPLFDMEPPTSNPYTLTQGDCRHDNAFYREGEEGLEATLFDWQMAGKSSPVSDVTRWLTQSVRTEVRRDNEGALLAWYLECLGQAGVRFPAWRLRLEYRLDMARQLVTWVIANEMLDFEGTSERAVALQQAVIGRLDASLVDHNVLRVIRVSAWLIRALNIVNRIRRSLTRGAN